MTNIVLHVSGQYDFVNGGTVQHMTIITISLVIEHFSGKKLLWFIKIKCNSLLKQVKLFIKARHVGYQIFQTLNVEGKTVPNFMGSQLKTFVSISKVLCLLFFIEKNSQTNRKMFLC